MMAEVNLGLATDDVSLLVLLLEANPLFWGSKNESADSTTNLPLFLSQVGVLINSYLALHHLNRLAVIAVGAASCTYLYRSSSSSFSSSSSAVPPGVAQRGAMDCVREGLHSFGCDEVSSIRQRGADVAGGASMLSGGLSLALTWFSLLKLVDFPDGSDPQNNRYIAIMNSIFSAQRLQIPIDCCMLGSQHSAFLQQAAHLTRGVYCKPEIREGLLQYLLMVSVSDLQSRDWLQLPRPTGVDFRASCFCHKKTIEMGWVCSVCLSVVCQSTKNCSTCGASYNKAIAALPAGNGKSV